MRVLIACEYSGKVRSAFEKMGHDAVSCDLLPTEKPGFHYTGDVFDIINQGWDLMVAHPPCTDLAVSGAAWFKEKIADGRQQRALDFVQALMDAPIPMIAIENPISVISSKIRKPDQIIQPWMFGHKETKATCLWLKGLPKLVPTTDLKEETMALPKKERMRLHYLPPSADRWKIRSETFQGIADAMANQWGKV
jgi:site-specific DNA-cytosine methylase